MSSYATNSSLFLYILSFLTYFFIASAQDPSFINNICPNTTTYTRNSTYASNLKTLLSLLSSDNRSFSNGFVSTSAGQNPEVVYGLFLCRGDLSPEVCRRCVLVSINQTSTRCPNEREVILYYDECMIRYSSRNINLLNTALSEGVVWNNTQNVTSNKRELGNLVLAMMNQAAIEASRNSQKFSVRMANFTEFQSLYGLVQCTPDLTEQNCLSCLQQIINLLPAEYFGGRVVVPSCNIRYEIYLFYNASKVGTPRVQLDSPPLPSSPPSFKHSLFSFITCI